MTDTGGVTVELLGLARMLAARDCVHLEAGQSLSLPALLLRLTAAAPALVGHVLTPEGALVAGHVLSRNGVDFLRSPDDLVHPGDHLLLLSTSAGG